MIQICVLKPATVLRISLALLFLSLHGTSVRAQIVNIEDKRRALDTLGWFGQVDLNGTLSKNNTRVLTMGGNVRLDRLGERGNVLLLADYRLVKVDGNNALNAGFLHARYGYEPPGSDGWRWESFTQVQYNEQLRLNLRFLAGTGLRRRLYRNGSSRAYLGVLYMYEYDELDASSITYRDHRVSSYLTFNWRATPDLTLSGTSYYQPRLFAFDDVRISTVATATLNISRRLRFTSKYSLTHDARVTRDLPDVPATNYNWSNGLRWTF